MSCEDTFMNQLRKRGFRFTPQREIVLSVLHQLEDYANVEEITSRVHEHSTSIDISTVYRTLDLLQKFDLVACVDTGDDQRRYKLLTGHTPHVYLVCQNCKKVTPLNLTPFTSLATHLKEQLGFNADFDHLSIPGLCRFCHSKRKNREELSRRKEVPC